MADDVMADLAALYKQALAPVEPVKFTRDQLDWLKAHLAPPEPRPYGLPDPAALFGRPIHIVDTIEESTPHEKGWPGWDVDLATGRTTPGQTSAAAPAGIGESSDRTHHPVRRGDRVPAVPTVGVVG